MRPVRDAGLYCPSLFLPYCWVARITLRSNTVIVRPIHCHGTNNKHSPRNLSPLRDTQQPHWLRLLRTLRRVWLRLVGIRQRASLTSHQSPAVHAVGDSRIPSQVSKSEGAPILNPSKQKAPHHCIRLGKGLFTLWCGGAGSDLQTTPTY